MNKTIRLTLLTLLPFCLWAQTLTRMVAQFPVIVEGDTLSMPFSGGFNGPIPQFLDWDHDGFLDLFHNPGSGGSSVAINNGGNGTFYSVSLGSFPGNTHVARGN